MSDEDIRTIIQEATKESLNQSFTEAGMKYITAAQLSEEKGDIEGAEKLFHEATEAFTKAAERYRTSKSFKNAALNMCFAADVYSQLANSPSAIQAYEQAADDLFSASSEHIMWGEDAEVKKGTALAIAASMIYIMIGKDDLAFNKARSFSAENASKIIFPGVIRISQIPQQLHTAIQSVNISAFSEAENAVVTELKSALANAGAQDFSKYVDKGLEMAREMIRAKIKVPKVNAVLDLPVDMTFSESFTLKVRIENSGDGDAHGLRINWIIDDGLILVSGSASTSISRLPAGEFLDFEVTAKSARELMGEKEYQVLVKGAYKDMLNTEYSLQAGPGTFILRDFKMTEKLLHDLDVTEGRLSILSASLENSPLETEPLSRMIKSISSSSLAARVSIKEKELNDAKARIAVINEAVDAIDETIGDESMIAEIERKREEAKRQFAIEQIGLVKNEIRQLMENKKNSLEDEAKAALQEWDSSEEERKKLVELVKTLSKQASEMVSMLGRLYQQMPPASGTEDPTEAAQRTGARTSIEDARSHLAELQSKMEMLVRNDLLTEKTRPTVPKSIHTVQELAGSMLKAIEELIEKKKQGL